MLERMQKGNSSYAVYEISDPSTEFDTVSTMMINSNRNKKTGLAPIVLESMNGFCNKLLFDITGKVSLGEYLKQDISQNDFKNLILNLAETIECFDEYMIDSNEILFDLNNVYINAIDGTINFICIVVKNFIQPKNMYEFFRDVVLNCYVTVDTSEISYFECVRNAVRTENGFSLDNLRESMNVTKKPAVQNTVQPPIRPPVQPSVQSVQQSPVQQMRPPEIQQPAQPVQTMNYNVPNKAPMQMPKAITVKNTPKQKEIVPPIAEQNAKEKKSFFRGLFSSSKKKKTESEIQTQGFQSGLANLKNGAKPNVSSAQPSVNPMANPVAGAVQQNMQQPTMNPSFNIGTTALNVINNHAQSSVAQTNIDLKKAPVQSQQIQLQQFQPAQQVRSSPGTTVLNKQQYNQQYSGATTVLRQNKQCFLIRVKTNQQFLLQKDVIHIGRDEPQIDCNISDNTAIGHKHANILKHENGYCVIDLNSVNHTYINDQIIESGMEYPINNGDIITFADEKFRFVVR